MTKLDFKEFSEKFNIKLNSQQTEAVSATDGAVLLLAVPGSGKTTVLVTRLGYMIFGKGISPDSILTMTYTVAATRDMRLRFASLFGSELAAKLNFSTINSVSCQIIRYFERTSGRKAFELISSEQELSKLVGDIYKSVTGDFAQEGDIKNIRTLITYAKNMLLEEDEIKALKKECKSFSAVYSEYNRILLENKKMDFDDQMVYAYKILRIRPEVLSYFRNRYRYICVDEAQDTSKIQHMIIRLLAGENGNVFMVGDEDQSIYGFRAAYPEALMDFEKVYKNPKVLMLETNYRSTWQIVENADSFIKKNKTRRPKNMKAAMGSGSDIKSVKFRRRTDQYDYIVKLAENSHTETAVLYRDNDSAVPIIDIFERRGIDYWCRGNDSSFFSHAVVRDIEDIINFAYNPYDGDLFMRIYYKFNKGISKVDALNAVKFSEKKKLDVFTAMLKYCELSGWCAGNVRELAWSLEIIRESSAAVAVGRIRRLIGYQDYLESRGADTSKLDILEAVAVNAGNAADFVSRLHELETIIRNGSDRRCNFILSTIHSAKGLEYENVIIVDAVDGLFPKIEGNFTSESDRMLLEEERRLFYVGVTRAKRQLTLFEYENSSSMFTSHFFPDVKPAELKPSLYKKSPDVAAKGFSDGDTILHKSFGKGKINTIKNGVAEIEFASYGTKYIDVSVAVKYGIIRK